MRIRTFEKLLGQKSWTIGKHRIMLGLYKKTSHFLSDAENCILQDATPHPEPYVFTKEDIARAAGVPVLCVLAAPIYR